METFISNFNGGLQLFLSLSGMTTLLFGCMIGIIGGALPGLSPSTTVALLVPLSFKMDPAIGIAFLCSVYLASNFGGSITAITLNAPGTPAAAVTAIDGYHLAQKGHAKKAIDAALIASTFGGLIGIIILITLATPLSEFALKFDSASYCSLAAFGLLSVVLMNANKSKNIIAITLGILVKCVGLDPISGSNRFSFGLEEMYSGFQTIPALIGLFAVSQILIDLKLPLTIKIDTPKTKDIAAKDRWKLFFHEKFNILRSSIIGTIIGIFPGAGSTIAAFISYDMAKAQSKQKESFGKGSLKGVVASEAANSASVGGALVPLLALGIPGSATDAVLIGAFMLHDINPGPLLMSEQIPIVYGIFSSLFLASILIFILGLSSSKAFAKISHIEKNILYPIVLSLALIGCYSINSSLFDAFTCLLFGVLGWILKTYSYPVSSVVLGMVLATMLEENFRRALLENGLTSFLAPIPATLLLLPIILFIIIKTIRQIFHLKTI
ncbi:MAG: tripartite tricarboxylate transporter permease [Bdellovibrionota bacterium]